MTEQQLIISDNQIEAYNEFRGQLAELKQKNTSLVFDYEDAAGNRAARSHIHQLRRTKGAVEKVRKAEKAQALKYGRMVDGEAKEIVAEIDDMIAVHERPLKEIEEREARRVEAIRDRIDWIRSHAPEGIDQPEKDALDAALSSLQATEIDESYAEFAAEAMVAKKETVAAIEAALKAAQEREELERLRREKEERDRAERERALKEQAAKEAREAAEREAEARRQRERDEHEAKLRAEQEQRERAEREVRRALAEKAEADQRAARAAKEAEEKAKREQRERQEKAEAEQRRRDESKRIRARVQKDIATAMIELLPDPGDGGSLAFVRNLIAAIDEGKIPHVSITY